MIEKLELRLFCFRRRDGVPQVGSQFQVNGGARLDVGIEHFVVSAAPVLGAIHGGVRVAQQLFGALFAAAAQSNADAGRRDIFVASQGEGRLQRFDDALGDARGLAGSGDVLDQHHELVAAQTRGCVFGPQTGAQSLSDFDQQLIAGFVAQAIVDVFEMIEIEKQNRARTFAALCAGDGAAQSLHQQRAVGQLGQRVVKRLMRQPVLVVLESGDVAERPDAAIGDALWRQRRSRIVAEDAPVLQISFTGVARGGMVEQVVDALDELVGIFQLFQHVRHELLLALHFVGALRRHFPHLDEAAVAARDGAPRIHQRDAFARSFLRRFQHGVAAPQLLAGLPARRDVLMRNHDTCAPRADEARHAPDKPFLLVRQAARILQRKISAFAR